MTAMHTCICTIRAVYVHPTTENYKSKQKASPPIFEHPNLGKYYEYPFNLCSLSSAKKLTGLRNDRKVLYNLPVLVHGQPATNGKVTIPTNTVPTTIQLCNL